MKTDDIDPGKIPEKIMVLAPSVPQLLAGAGPHRSDPLGSRCRSDLDVLDPFRSRALSRCSAPRKAHPPPCLGHRAVAAGGIRLADRGRRRDGVV
jgi:hypothetical protein